MLDLAGDLLARARLVSPRRGGTRLTGVFTPDCLPPAVLAATARPPLEPYQGLAALWHEHWSEVVAPYGDYAAALQRGGRLGRGVALDLACGTGLVAAALAPHFRRVQAVDASPHMLAEARRRLGVRGNVTCRVGTFESFEVEEPVDLVVCAGNSLNYLLSTEALAALLTRVRCALAPGGRFVFDLQSPAAFEACSGRIFRYRRGEEEWYQAFAWDPRTRLDASWALTRSGLERHPRRSFSREEVSAAARAAGLEPTDRFDAWPLRLLQRSRSWDFHEFHGPAPYLATSRTTPVVMAGR